MTNKRLSFDRASKAVLREDSFRAGIIKYLIEDYRDMSVTEVKKLISEVLPVTDETIPKSKITYDILFTAKLPNSDDSIGIYIDIEPQGYKESDARLVNRSLYYCCRLLARQHNNVEGGFVRGEYEKLKKVYSVWIITDEIDKARRGTSTRIKLIEMQDNVNEKVFKNDIYDKMEMVFLYPKNRMEKSKEDLLSFLSVLFTDDGTLNEKLEVLQSVYRIEVSDKEMVAMNGFLNVNEEQIMNRIEEAELKGRVESSVEYVKSIMESLGTDMETAVQILKIEGSIKQKVMERLSDKEGSKQQ